MNKEPSRINNPFTKSSAPKTATAQPSIQKNDSTRDCVKKQLLDALEISGDSSVQNLKFPSDTLNLAIENAVYLLFGKNSQDKGYREKIKRIVNRLKGSRNQHVREILKNGMLTVDDFCKLDDKTLNDDNYFKSGEKTTETTSSKPKGGMRPPQLKNIPFKVIDLDSVENTLEENKNENMGNPPTQEKENQELQQAQLKGFDAEGSYHDDNQKEKEKLKDNDLKQHIEEEKSISDHVSHEKRDEIFFKAEPSVQFHPPQKSNLRNEKEQISLIENQTFDAPIDKGNMNVNIYEDNLNKSFTSNSNSKKLKELQDLVAKKNAAKEPNQKIDKIKTAKHQPENDIQEIHPALQNIEAQADATLKQAAINEEIIDQPLQIPKNTTVNQLIQEKIEAIPSPSAISQAAHVSPSLSKNSPNKDISELPLKSTEKNKVTNEILYNSSEEEILNHPMKIETINIENETNCQNNDSTISPSAREKKEAIHILSASERYNSPKIECHSNFKDNSLKEKFKNINESKLSLETSLELARKECQYYQKEISLMRETINELRSKLSHVNEESYKLEISQLKQNLQFKASELEIVLKENKNLILQLQKYQDNMSLMIKDNNTFRLETEKRFTQYQTEIERMRTTQLAANTSQIAKNENIEKEKHMNVEYEPEMPISTKEPNSIVKAIEIFYPRVNKPQSILQIQPIIKSVPPREEDYDYNNFTNGNGNPNIIEEAGSSNYLNMNGNMYDETKIDDNNPGQDYYEDNLNSQNIDEYQHGGGTAKNPAREGNNTNESKTGESGATNNIFNSTEDDTKREPHSIVEMKKETNAQVNLFQEEEDPANLFGAPENASPPIIPKSQKHSQMGAGNNPKQQISKSGKSSINKKIAAPTQAQKPSQNIFEQLEADEDFFQKDGSEKLFDIFEKQKKTGNEAKNSLFD